MALFGKPSGPPKPDLISKPVDPGWARAATGKFLSFLELDPEEAGLAGKGGVFMIWHGGVRPEWVHVAHAADLSAALHEAGKNKDITGFETMGGLFVSWALVKPEYRPGVVRFLEENLQPQVPTSTPFGEDVVPVPVFSPGAEPKEPAPT